MIKKSKGDITDGKICEGQNERMTEIYFTL